MFRGSVPAPMQSIISEITKSWACMDVYIGCSGNFTIERILGKDKKFKLHSNDVTIYSVSIGRYLVGEPIGLAIKDEWLDRFGWLNEYMETESDCLSTVLLSTRLLERLDKDNLYYVRMRNAYKKQWPSLHAKTVEKINSVGLRLESFFEGDVVDWLEQVPDDQGVICFPPFFTGDYKNMFANLEQVFSWQEPEYQEITEERKDLLFDRMRKKKYWILGLNYRLDGWEKHLRGVTQTTNRGVPIYVYASGNAAHIVQPRQEIEHVLNPRLQRGQEVGDNIALAVLSSAQFQALRSQYMNRYINPGMATVAVAVMVDGFIVGVYAISPASATANWDSKVDTPYVYLLSDFPVEPTDYARLSKLVLYAALSKEGKMLAERVVKHRVRSIITTAFTDRPVSMKYRGLFELLGRKENKDWQGGNVTPGSYYNQRYMLNYGALMGQWTISEGLKQWKKKHGVKRS